MTTTITLHEGDNRESLRRLIDQGVRVHSVVTDPPYGLTSISKRFGKDGAAPAKFGTDGAFARASAGFMGSKWDGTGIERDPEFWRLIWEILLPGGYVVAFSGSRTGHWQACAMEMAGFIMHPMLGWLFGQGFPKAHNAGRAVEAQMLTGGAAPKNIRTVEMGDNYRPHELAGTEGYGTSRGGGIGKDKDRDYEARPPLTTPEAKQWEGWAYGGQALKPALEPIFVGQKPFSEKNGALNLLKHGVGAINLDACRVPSPGETIANHSRGAESAVSKGIYGDSSAQDTHQTAGQALGRHPANLLHDGSAEVVALFPQTSSGTGAVKRRSAFGAESRHEGAEMISYGDAGSAARFFNAFGYSDVEEVIRLIGCTDAEGREIVAYLEQHLPLSPGQPTFYHGKATKADRAGSKHPTVKPIALMRWLCRLVTPPGGTVLDPFAGSGTTGAAAREEGFDCILMEGEQQFCADIRSRFDIPSPSNDDSFDALLGDSFEALLA